MVQSVVGVPDIQIPRVNEVAPSGEPTHFSMEDLLALEDFGALFVEGNSRMGMGDTTGGIGGTGMIGDIAAMDRKRQPAVYDPSWPAKNLNRWMTVSYAFESAKAFTLEIAAECDQCTGSDDHLRLFFSDKPKKEKLALATESINTKLAEASRAIAGNIGKMAGHLADHFKKHVASGELALTPAELQAKQGAIDELKHDTLSGEAVQAANVALHNAGKVRPVSTHGSVSQERFSMDPTYHQAPPLTGAQADILGSAEYTKLIEELLGVVEDSQPTTTLALARKAYNEAMRKGDGLNEDKAALKANFYQMMVEPRKAHQALMAELKKIDEKMTQVDNGHVEIPHDINHALRNFTQAASSPRIANYVRERAELVPELERLRKEAIEQGAGTENVEGARDVFREMHGLLAVIMKADITFQKYWKNLMASCGYLQAVMGQAQLALRQKMIEKGMVESKIEQHPEIMQMQRINAALGVFRKKGA